jgi:hypothetical protein
MRPRHRRSSPTATSSRRACGSGPAGNWLNWAHNQACEAIDPRSEDKAGFAERALRETLDDPLTLAKLSSFLDALVTRGP